MIVIIRFKIYILHTSRHKSHLSSDLKNILTFSLEKISQFYLKGQVISSSTTLNEVNKFPEHLNPN